MSLFGVLNIGQNALATQQASIQTTGNNIANAGNADYTRQVASVTASKDQQIKPGTFVGTGIDLTAIQRQIDDALEGRLRGSISDAASADTTQTWLGRVQSVFNELSDSDLSTQLSTFFKSWSDLANKPQDTGLRQVVLQDGDAVASYLQNMRQQFFSLQGDVNQQLGAKVAGADQLASQIANVNSQIVTAEAGTGGIANGLRDQRDGLIKQLAQLVDVKTIPQNNGMVNVYIGSEPLVVGADSRGIALKNIGNGANIQQEVVFKKDQGNIPVTGGQIGALVGVQTSITDVIVNTDSIAHNLIFELNKLHSSGQGLQGFNTVTSTNLVSDPNAALNDPKARLGFTPTNGSFVVHVKDKVSGLTTSTLVQVDLDGLNNNDTTLNSLAATLGGITNVSASVSAGKLTVKTNSNDTEISFSQDSSGVLAALGVNNFYTGTNASDIAVSQTLKTTPGLLAAAKNGDQADNQTALAIAALESQPLAAFNGVSLKDQYQAIVNGVAVSAANAKNNATATQVVQQTLQAQRDALSGVSLDEEAINLVRQQRAYQAAAKLISAVDEMMKTLLAM